MPINCPNYSHLIPPLSLKPFSPLPQQLIPSFIRTHHTYLFSPSCLLSCFLSFFLSFFNFMMMRSYSVLVLFVSLAAIGLVSCDSPSSSALQDKCASDFTKLGECLSYATAKADAPTSGCCGSISEIREKEAVCLCYIIQQAHSGGSAASMGLQTDRLTKLPSACKLANSDISNCPKLLNLSPSSPDNAIFSNSTKASTATSASSSSTPTSQGIRNNIQFSGIFMTALISVVCLFVF